MSEVNESPDTLLEAISSSKDENAGRKSSLSSIASLLEGERYDQFIGELGKSMDSIARKLESVNFDEDEDILVLVSGKSRFIAENLWGVFINKLPEEHPIRTRGKLLGLDDVENAALYGKYEEKDGEKFEQQKKMAGQNYEYIKEKAKTQALLGNTDKKPKIVLFEEYSNTDAKSLTSISRLRQAGYETYACVLSGMTEEDRDYFRQSYNIKLPDDVEQINKYLFVGSREQDLHNIMYRLAVVRSSQAADVLKSRNTKRRTVTDSERKGRQLSRDLIRRISKDLSS